MAIRGSTDGTSDVPAARTNQWSGWLAQQLDARGWRRSDLVNRSGIKENDRPVIDASTVKRWIEKGVRPEYDFVLVAADTLGVSRQEALIAAGYAAAPPPESPAELARAMGRAEGLDGDDLDAFVRDALSDLAYAKRRARTDDSR